jgi:CBS domain-containing protein
MSGATRIATPRLYLNAETAADLMTPNPVSVRQNATVREAVALFVERGISAAPVIDATGRPVGVISQSDVLVHELEQGHDLPEVPEYYTRADLVGPEGERLPEGFHAERADRTRVEEIMTPVVFAANDSNSAREVVEQMKGLRVHRLFVVDREGTLVGVISLFDILNKLCP